MENNKKVINLNLSTTFSTSEIYKTYLINNALYTPLNEINSTYDIGCIDTTKNDNTNIIIKAASICDFSIMDGCIYYSKNNKLFCYNINTNKKTNINIKLEHIDYFIAYGGKIITYSCSNSEFKMYDIDGTILWNLCCDYKFANKFIASGEYLYCIQMFSNEVYRIKIYGTNDDVETLNIKSFHFTVINNYLYYNDISDAEIDLFNMMQTTTELCKLNLITREISSMHISLNYGSCLFCYEENILTVVSHPENNNKDIGKNIFSDFNYKETSMLNALDEETAAKAYLSMIDNTSLNENDIADYLCIIDTKSNDIKIISEIKRDSLKDMVYNKEVVMLSLHEDKVIRVPKTVFKNLFPLSYYDKTCSGLTALPESLYSENTISYEKLIEIIALAIKIREFDIPEDIKKSSVNRLRVFKQEKCTATMVQAAYFVLYYAQDMVGNLNLKMLKDIRNYYLKNLTITNNDLNETIFISNL